MKIDTLIGRKDHLITPVFGRVLKKKEYAGQASAHKFDRSVLVEGSDLID